MNRTKEFKQLDKSLRKQAIINTAARLFHQKGYSTTSLDDVSKGLGITKPALYHYVKNKDELLTIIYTQAFDKIFKNTREISTMALPPDEKLRRIVRHHITNIIMKDLSMFSVFFSEESQLPKKDFHKIREEKRRYTAIFETIINDGINEGRFKKVNPKLQAYAIIGMCNWVYKWYKAGRTPFSPEEICDHFIHLLEAGYLTTGKEPQTSIPEEPGRSPESRRVRRREELFRQIRRHSRKLNELVAELENL